MLAEEHARKPTNSNSCNKCPPSPHQAAHTGFPYDCCDEVDCRAEAVQPHQASLILSLIMIVAMRDTRALRDRHRSCIRTTPHVACVRKSQARQNKPLSREFTQGSLRFMHAVLPLGHVKTHTGSNVRVLPAEHQGSVLGSNRLRTGLMQLFQIENVLNSIAFLGQVRTAALLHRTQGRERTTATHLPPSPRLVITS